MCVLHLGMSFKESFLETVESESLSLFFVVYVQILEEGQFPKPCLLQNWNIADWTSQQVARWLVGIHLEHHIPEFTAQSINGDRLLQLESPELKVRGGLHSFRKRW